MRTIVTGGAGFIGSAMVRRLSGTEVLTIDKLTYAGSLTSLRAVENAPHHHFLHADIADFAAMRTAFINFRPDRILHLAAETHVDRSIDSAKAFIQTNVMGTFSLLEAARAYWGDLSGEARDRFRFLHVSTDEVYGSLGDEGQFTESTPYDPSSPYSASKAASDHLARAWHRTYGLPVLVTNSSNNYGPYQFPEKLIPLTIINALEGRPIDIYGDGGNVRDWLHAEDHVAALELIAQKGIAGATYNIGSRNERRNIDVVRAICAALDVLRPNHAPHERLVRFVKDRPGHDRRYAIDPTRLETELGWRAHHGFETGIARTVSWYVDNEWWWRPLRDKVYRGERLGTAVAEQAADRSDQS